MTIWTISPSPVTLNENAGSQIFTINRSDSVQAATVFASTVQDQGFGNNGIYSGILNQAVSFSAGQSAAQVSLGIHDLGLTSGSESFRLIVQQHASDPTSTWLASDTFTILNNDVAAS